MSHGGNTDPLKVKRNPLRSLVSVAFILLSFVFVLVLAGNGGGVGKEYPSDVVKIIIPYTAGSGTDNVSRLMVEQVSRETGHAFVVENRPGGGTVIGTRELARSKPDGYTLGIFDPAFPINPGLHESLPYDNDADFAPISLLTTNPLVLVVPASEPVHTLEEFIAYARRAESPLKYASPGYGSAGHIVFEQLLGATGLKLAHIPYQGSGAALSDLLSGRVSAMFLSENSALPHIRAGNLRALAATGPEGATLLPEVPAFHKAGLPEVNLQTFTALMAPSGTPLEVIQTVRNAFSQALDSPFVRERFAQLGVTRVVSTPEELSAYLASQSDNFKSLINRIRRPAGAAS